MILFVEWVSTKKGIGSKFTSRYKINSLVYYEEGDNVEPGNIQGKTNKGLASIKKDYVDRRDKPRMARLEQILV